MNTRLLFAWLLSFALGPTLAHAAQVNFIGSSKKLLAVEHEFPTTWKLNDYVCLKAPKDWDSSEAYVPECGWVILVTRRGAVVKFEEVPDDIEVGRDVERGTNPPDKSNTTAENVRREAENRHWAELITFHSRLGEIGNFASSKTTGGGGDSGEGGFEFAKNALSVGIGIDPFRPAGLSATSLIPTMKTNPMPSLLIIRMVQDEHTDFGLAAGFSMYSDDGVTGTTLSGYAIYDYYFEKVFHGWWLQGSAGVSQSTNKGIDGEAFEYIGVHTFATVGYRFGGPPLNFGLAAGVHGLFIPKIPARNMKIVQLLPSVLFDVAWAF